MPRTVNAGKGAGQGRASPGVRTVAVACAGSSLLAAVHPHSSTLAGMLEKQDKYQKALPITLDALCARALPP